MGRNPVQNLQRIQLWLDLIHKNLFKCTRPENSIRQGWKLLTYSMHGQVRYNVGRDIVIGLQSPLKNWKKPEHVLWAGQETGKVVRIKPTEDIHKAMKRLTYSREASQAQGKKFCTVPWRRQCKGIAQCTHQWRGPYQEKSENAQRHIKC